MWLMQRFTKHLDVALTEGQKQHIDLLSGPKSDLCPATHLELNFWPVETVIDIDSKILSCTKD